ncbi:MAG: hypothetical protein ACI8UO_005934 [Verrucomicrobiales bacterium]|jgi:hypothetical protein
MNPDSRQIADHNIVEAFERGSLKVRAQFTEIGRVVEIAVSGRRQAVDVK